MSTQSDAEQTNLTLFCMQAQENPFVWVASHLLMLGFIGLNMLLMGRFWRLTGNFPVRERAPKIAMLQSTVYLFLILVIYTVEVLTNHNWVDWDDASTEDDIPVMRKVFKAAYLTIRLNIYLVFLARTAVIYFRWTRKSSLVVQPNPYEQETELPATGIFRGLRRMLERERNMFLLIFLWLPSCGFMFYSWKGAMRMVTGYPSLDWFPQNETPQFGLMGKIITGTDLHVAEVLLMTLSFWIHRKFPKEFSLSKEILANLVVAWLIDTYINVTYMWQQGKPDDFCIGPFRSNGWVDLSRCFSFVFIMYSFAQRQYTRFPLPFTWVFQDFSKFIFQPECAAVFAKYVRAKEGPQNVETLQKLMSLFVSEFSGERSQSVTSRNRDSETNAAWSNAQLSPSRGVLSSGFNQTFKEGIGSTPNARHSFLEVLNKLEPCFQRYQHTKSYRRLFRRIKEFEDITEGGASMW